LKFSKNSIRAFSILSMHTTKPGEHVHCPRVFSYTLQQCYFTWGDKGASEFGALSSPKSGAWNCATFLAGAAD